MCDWGILCRQNRYEAAVDAERASVECVCDLRILTSSAVSVAWPLMQQSEYEEHLCPQTLLVHRYQVSGKHIQEHRTPVQRIQRIWLCNVASTFHKPQIHR